MIPIELGPSASTPIEVVCLGAHSDDIEIGCGGSILRLIAGRSSRLHWVVMSAAGERRREAEESARRFTAEAAEAVDLRVTIHDFDDGDFPSQRPRLKEALRDLRREAPADLVFTHDEQDLHQDHSVLGSLTREVFRDHLTLGYEIPKYDGGLRTPNVFVALDEGVMRRKVSLLAECFPSQSDKHWFSDETFLGLMRLRGIECRAPGGYAEGFHAPKVRLEMGASSRAATATSA